MRCGSRRSDKTRISDILVCLAPHLPLDLNMSVSELRAALNHSASSIVSSDERCLGLAAEAEAVARYTAQNLNQR